MYDNVDLGMSDYELDVFLGIADTFIDGDYQNTGFVEDTYGENADNGYSESELLETIERLGKKIEQYKKELHDNQKTIALQQDEIKRLKEKQQALKAPARREDINIQVLCELYQSGYSQNQIAKRLGCSRATVKARLMENGQIR